MKTRTTLLIEQALMMRVKALALEQDATIGSVLEDLLRLGIKDYEAARKKPLPKLPVSKQKGGLRPGVNINNNAALLDIMEDR